MGGLLLVGVVAGGTGCSQRPPQTGGPSPFGAIDTIITTEASRDSVLAVLDRMRRTAFDSAFARLDAYAVTRHLRTERMDTTGVTTAFRTLTLRYPAGPEGPIVQRADSAGSFREGGLLSGITPTQQRPSTPVNLARQALADEPAYLAPRTQEAYRYALRRDSLFDGSPAFVVEATARSDERGTDQDLRYARLTIARPSYELVGLTTIRISQILLFKERSQLSIHLRPAPDEGWVPHLTRFRAFIDIPFRAPRQFRTVSAYYGYEGTRADS